MQVSKNKGSYSKPRVSKYLWVVFSISRMEGDRLEVQAAIEIHRGNDVSLHAR